MFPMIREIKINIIIIYFVYKLEFLDVLIVLLVITLNFLLISCDTRGFTIQNKINLECRSNIFYDNFVIGSHLDAL